MHGHLPDHPIGKPGSKLTPYGRNDTSDLLSESSWLLATPQTSAELDRVARTGNYGRAVLTRCRDSGHIPPHLGKSVPAMPE